MNRLAPRMLVLMTFAFLVSGSPARAQGFAVYLNTTEDLPVEASHCLPGQICPLRSAIERIEGAGVQGTIRACYEAGTPQAKRCPPLAQPLKRDDPGYDAASGKWYFEFSESGLAYNLSENGTTFDFTLDIEDWSSPADNKIVITPGPGVLEHAFIVESSGNVFKGFDISGDFGIAAIVARAGLINDGATNNQFGPGLAFYDIRPGVGIQLRDRGTTGNRVYGNWCGISGDGSQELPLQDDCVQITLGASGNQVGGDRPEDRNVFAASTLGSGVSITEGSHANKVIGNWLGLDALGDPAGLEAGVTVKIGSNDTEIRANLISGNESSGIALYDGSYKTRIAENVIGLLPDGLGCAGNGQLGIQINDGVTESQIERNQLSCNDKGGISISGRGATANQLVENAIWNNVSGIAVQISQGANGGVKAPKVNSVAGLRVIGSAPSCKGGRVDLYSDTAGEAQFYEGSLTADGATGLFIYEAAAPFQEVFVTAMCTDVNGNSSALSDAVPVGGSRPTATDEPTRPSPTPDPNSTDVPILSRTFIPVVMKAHPRR